MQCEKKSNNDGGKKGRFDRDFKKFPMMELFYGDRTRDTRRLLTHQTSLHLLWCGVVVLEAQIRDAEHVVLNSPRNLGPHALRTKSGTEVLTQFSWNTVLSSNVFILFLS
jgi:hypothetical protein